MAKLLEQPIAKMEQPIGEETYEITRESDTLSVKMDFKFNDRGTDVPLTATFRAATDISCSPVGGRI